MYQIVFILIIIIDWFIDYINNNKIETCNVLLPSFLCHMNLYVNLLQIIINLLVTQILLILFILLITRLFLSFDRQLKHAAQTFCSYQSYYN